MLINPEDLSPIKELLKVSGFPLKEGEFENVISVLNEVLQQTDVISKQAEAEVGPEMWAKLKAEVNVDLDKVSQEFNEKLQEILKSAELSDKL